MRRLLTSEPTRQVSKNGSTLKWTRHAEERAITRYCLTYRNLFSVMEEIRNHLDNKTYLEAKMDIREENILVLLEARSRLMVVCLSADCSTIVTFLPVRTTGFECLKALTPAYGCESIDQSQVKSL